MVSSISLVLFLSISLLLSTYFHFTEAGGKWGRSSQPIASGLSWDYYKFPCPDLEPIVRWYLERRLKNNKKFTGAMLQLFFHDCFVLGCDGSIMLDRINERPSEKDAPPNLYIPSYAYETVDDIKRSVRQQCGIDVSCADILALSARDAIYLSGGPDFDVPLGRRDGIEIATVNEIMANLIPPSSNTTTILNSFAAKGFTTTDVVALSGGHTIGISHCTSFTDRLYPSQDPTMDKTLAKKLRTTCPTLDSNNTAPIDIRTPYTFDNKYYVDLVNRQGLFTSDQDLFTDPRTRGIVRRFAVDEDLFYSKFVSAMVKMSQLNVLTGNQGEIRLNCRLMNENNELLSSMAEETKEKLSAF